MEHVEFLQLADWRRRVAVMWADWRAASSLDPERATAEFRSAKDALFRDHPQSPIAAADRAAFIRLSYSPYDPAYRMRVLLESPEAMGSSPLSTATGVPSAGEALRLPNSGREAISFRRIGMVRLVGPLGGEALSVFWIEGYGGGLFLPFRDATSGSETYGAGRYLLDTIKSADHGGDAARSELVLDFNMAYHPSCAYDPRWACPLAPPENRIRTPVRVGERLG